MTTNFFRTVGVAAQLGRAFVGNDDAADEAPVVISYGFWQRKFGGDPETLGRRIDLDDVPRVIVGVMPRDFEMPVRSDLWLPLRLTASERARRDALTLHVIGRLVEGTTVARARAEFAAIDQRLAREYPSTNANRRIRVLPIAEYVQGSITRAAVFLLFGCVGVVLAIACANLAGLQLARVAHRRRESSLRSALGASRWRVAQLSVVENLLIAALAGAAGAPIASVFVSLLLESMPPDIARLIPGFARIRVDARVIGFIALVSVVSGGTAAIAPAVRLSHAALVKAIKEGRQRLRTVFVVAQIAVALVMLVVATLFIRGQRDLLIARQVPEPNHVAVLSVSLPRSRYATPAARARFYERALQQLTLLPGARTAAVCSAVPLRQQWDILESC